MMVNLSIIKEQSYKHMTAVSKMCTLLKWRKYLIITGIHIYRTTKIKFSDAQLGRCTENGRKDNGKRVKMKIGDHIRISE